MATNLTTNLTLRLLTVFEDDLDLSDPKDTLNIDWKDSLANGTGTDQADVIWHDQRTVTGASEDIDLAGNVLFKDAFGNTITFVKVKAVFIHNTSTTATETLSVGGAAGTQFSNWVGAVNDEVNVGPDGLFMLWSPTDGYAVGAGATDLLKIDPGADTIIYDIVIIGTSA